MYEANDQIVCVHLPKGVLVDCIINSPFSGWWTEISEEETQASQ